jgi:hypothetical protein
MWLSSRLSSPPVLREGALHMADEIDPDTDIDDVETEEIDLEDDVDLEDVVDAVVDDDVVDLDDEDDDDAPSAAASSLLSDDDDEDEDDVEADLDEILRERMAKDDDDDDDDEDDDDVVVVVTKSKGKKAAPVDPDGEEIEGRRPDETVCTMCFMLVRETQLGPRGNRSCPSGELESDCPAIAIYDAAAK